MASRVILTPWQWHPDLTWMVLYYLVHITGLSIHVSRFSSLPFIFFHSLLSLSIEHFSFQIKRERMPTFVHLDKIWIKLKYLGNYLNSIDCSYLFERRISHGQIFNHAETLSFLLHSTTVSTYGTISGKGKYVLQITYQCIHQHEHEWIKKISRTM